MIVGGPACVNTEAVTDPALPRPMSEDYQAPSGAGHPITPPPELVEQWYDSIDNASTSWKQELAIQAARWGADQELKACCEWLQDGFGDIGGFPEKLRTARRPKPPSLKEQALAVLDDVSDRLDAAHENVLRRALERLQELEGNG